MTLKKHVPWVVLVGWVAVGLAGEENLPPKEAKEAKSPAASVPNLEGPPIRLFNGKDLRGWHADVPAADKDPNLPPSFIVRDGLLVSRGKPLGHLITDLEFENYRLLVEYRFPGQGGNCGVLVHASKPRALYDMFPQSLEVQLMSGNAGDFWCIQENIEVPDMEKRRPRKPGQAYGGGPGDARHILNLTDGSEKPLGQWNTMIIECLGREIKVWVNGDFVNHGFNCTARRGRIALQAEGTEVEFRKVDLYPIIGTEEPNTLTEEEKKEGWRLLFDGRTTAGWRGYKSNSMPASWKVENNSLLSRPGQGESRGDIITTEQFADFELLVDWKMVPKGNSGIVYRATEEYPFMWQSGPEFQILDNTGHLDGLNPLASAGACYAVFAPAMDVTRPVGQWNRTRILVQGNHVEHWLNGVKLLEYQIGSDRWTAHVKTSKFFQSAYGQSNWGRSPKGHIGLQDYGHPIEFRNIKIRALSSATP
ncbi:MAG: DUF1080 domain-containing protein [Thermoguttaceae bacterium]|nr:DUF1080 domain-containing protein [Thermoguttaceae bacterium]MDW8037060.1 DUF1080 domain-containing protein [Thermoguttaceae bacterium]